MILKNGYDLSKIMKISPVEYRKMTVNQARFFMQELNKDINNKDPWVTPSPKLSL